MEDNYRMDYDDYYEPISSTKLTNHLSCASGAHCCNSKCVFSHPHGWRVCSKGLVCFDFSCNLVHPKGRLKRCCKGALCLDVDCEDLHPDLWLQDSSRVEKEVKMRRRRLANRQKAHLPILTCAEDFVKRLKADKVVVVRAETGSGKTTQLPQYCAEEFQGLIVCTQPRVIAAISVAQRVAFEFDGAPVGGNVGYDAGNGRRVEGLRIMIMTDSALIRMAQKDRQLKNVEVLIIDEAHERTLNTDVVVGIAKTVLSQRPDDFKIVISSATMDPKPFLEFLFDHFKDVPMPLVVPGQVFPVTIETRVIKDCMDDIVAILAEEVARAMKRHRVGHCLVFLQGAREVERAIRMFKKISHPKWIPLPLYGSLPIKAQSRVLNFDDCNGALRMVVFCTNVAETSLTIPNVGLVIDTGLAKESHYDVNRRMTILDEVYISKSSAAQRKGRAGRTAKGHCIRLYPWEALTRNNIEPEILRSSLDLIMLQIFNLGFNPMEFKFIMRPDEDVMLSSLATLTRMGCLTPLLQLTDRGRLYNNLPFDPRLTHFVMLVHEVFAAGLTAMEIAAILSAPGSIFYFGKGTGASSRDSEDFNSDLLLMHSTYRTWFHSGTVDANDCCISCQKKIGVELTRKDSGCRECRVKNAKLNNLNNKNLENVRETVVQVHKLLKTLVKTGSSTFLPGSVENMDDAIGVCLAHSFGEQICEFVMPSNPAAGVYIIDSGMKGQLSNSSVLRKPNRDSRFLIPMSIKKLTSGLLIVEQAHHIMEECLPIEIREKILGSSLDVVECYRNRNLHYRYAARLRKHFEKLSDGNQSTAFVECVYDAPTTTVTVYAPRTQKLDIYKECQAEVMALYEEDLANTVVIEDLNMPIKLVVSSGLKIESLDRWEKPCNVNFPNPPVQSDDELLALACGITPCSPSDIKWHKYRPARINARTNCPMPSFGTVVFFGLEKAKLAESNYVSPDGEVASKSQSVDCRPRVIVTSNIGNMDEFLAARNINPADIKVTQNQSKHEVQATNMPVHVSETRLGFLMKHHRIPTPDYVRTFQPVNGKYFCLIGFVDASVRDQALFTLQGIPELNTTFSTTVATKKGQNKVQQVTTSFRAKAPNNSAKHSIIFQKAEEADKLYDLNGEIFDFKVDGVANVKVEHTKGFSIDKRLDMIAVQYGVKHRFGKKWEKWQEVVFYNGPPSKCVSAAESLKQMMTPIKYLFSSKDKQVMGRELRASGKFQQWAKEYKLHIEEMKSKRNVIGIAIHGDGYNQGQFMAQIADYYNTFMTRYHLVSLSQTACFLFRRMCPGEASLNNLAKAKSGECQITFQQNLSAIEFVVQPSAARPPAVVIMECQIAINDILSKFQQMPAAVKKCVFCHSRPGSPFTICGHHYCKECLEQVVDTQVVSFPSTDGLTRVQIQEMERKARKHFEQCPSCNTKISIKDLEGSLSKISMQNACVLFATLHLKSTDHPLGLCPVSSCGQIVDKKMGYAACLACDKDVCPLCGVIDDLRHRSHTCAEYRKLVLSTFASIDEMVEEAKKFAKENWQLDAGVQFGQIISVDVNPGLKNGCMAMQRYCTGIKCLGLPTLKGNTILAWHGTAEAAIPAICSQGFDPTRRRGQAYGPGEYFGVKASVSLGYAKGCNRLIVAQLVKCSSLSVHTNFAYVVNNPTDWNHAFNIPVLVIAFGSNLPAQIPWISDVKRPVPAPFFESGAIASESDAKKSAIDAIFPTSGGTSLKQSFRWHWTNGPNDLRPYPDAINDAMEKSYLRGQYSFVTQPINRNVDGASQSYQIDLLANTQTNLSTGYVRKIVRVQEDGSSKPSTVSKKSYYWHWVKDGGILEPYTDAMNDLINKNYKFYKLKVCGSVSFDTQPITRYNDNASQAYRIDFKAKTQTNLKTGYVREIERKTSKVSGPSTSQQSFRAHSLRRESSMSSGFSSGPSTSQQSSQSYISLRWESIVSPSSSSVPAARPYRWYWTKDDQSLEPYSDSLNDSIEGQYVFYKNGALTTFTTRPITRYKDAVPQQYKIDFNGSTQQNVSTGYIRKIERRGASNLSKREVTETVNRSSVRVSPIANVAQPIPKTTPLRQWRVLSPTPTPQVKAGQKPKKDCTIL